MEDAIEKREEDIEDNTKTIVSNNKTITKLKKDRCDANNRYVDSIVDYKDAMGLFEYLRKAISSYTGESSSSFVELTE